MEKFLKKLAEDEKLQAEFSAQKTQEGAYNIAKPYIGNMTKDEFSKQMVGLADLVERKEKGELDADDLDSVSGGGAALRAIGGVLTLVGGLFKKF